MTYIHYVECNTKHGSDFVVDVPAGYHWLMVLTKTPAAFWVNGSVDEYPAFTAVLYAPSQKVYYKACTDQYVNDWLRFESTDPYITETPLPLGIPFALHDPEYCHKLMELLVIEHNNDQDYKQSSIDHLLKILFNKLLESYYHGEITPHYYNLLSIRNAIQRNPGEPWTVAKMAELIGISPGYLQYLYKKNFGVSCMEDVINSRIRLAKEYLIHGNQSVSEVAERCGYQNVEHFCRQFKQITGETPGKYHTKTRV